MKKIIPIDTDIDGNAPTITADYGHVSKYHVLRTGRFGLLGVIILYDEDDTSERSYPKENGRAEAVEASQPKE